MLCKSCHYPLKQLTEPRCPECGRGFDPDNSNTYFVPPERRSRFAPKLLLVGGLAYLVAFGMVLSTAGPPWSGGLVLRAAGIATVMWLFVMLAALLFLVALHYARQMGIGLYKMFRWPYDDDPPLRS